MEERRDILDVLLRHADDADRARALAQIEANHAPAHVETIGGPAGVARLAPRSGRSGAPLRRSSSARSDTENRIFTSYRDQVTTVYVRDMAGLGATAFRTAVEHGMHAGQPLLVVDLDGVSFLDAAGLDVLVEAATQARRRGKRISVRRAHPCVYQGFVSAGLVSMLDVHPARTPHVEPADEKVKRHEHH